jgi:hypothetical protein
MLVKNAIYETLESWNEKNSKGPVRLYDFGDGQTNMPLPDFSGSGSYLTSSICFLYIEGTGPLPQGKVMERSDSIQDYGNGWKMLSLEIGYQCPPDKLLEALEQAKEKLLAAR